MHPQLRQAYEREMNAAIEQYHRDDLQKSLSHLERAHILGHSFPVPHARAHWGMLKVGWKRRDPIEIAGQVPRILGALLFSRIWVPVGNTGGAHVSSFKSMRVPEELQSWLKREERD